MACCNYFFNPQQIDEYPFPLPIQFSLYDYDYYYYSSLYFSGNSNEYPPLECWAHEFSRQDMECYPSLPFYETLSIEPISTIKGIYIMMMTDEFLKVFICFLDSYITIATYIIPCP
ncbi:hypothetical protein AHAS_Ahas16G0128700 [Arachis hypogaea]